MSQIDLAARTRLREFAGELGIETFVKLDQSRDGLCVHRSILKVFFVFFVSVVIILLTAIILHIP